MKKSGLEMVKEEREKQIEIGFTVNVDKALNSEGQLMKAALFLLQNTLMDDEWLIKNMPLGWKRDRWLRVCKKMRIERYAIAGAWVAAEIDRIQ